MSKPCLLPLFLCSFYQNAFDLFKYYTSLQFLSFSDVSFLSSLKPFLPVKLMKSLRLS